MLLFANRQKINHISKAEGLLFITKYSLINVDNFTNYSFKNITFCDVIPYFSDNIK
mgnify:FL=1|tara:strand:- start:6 stop:173 length:168 start_codon:yes stop_codon:yes gene_type:complete